jgi:hypothetical protein
MSRIAKFSLGLGLLLALSVPQAWAQNAPVVTPTPVLQLDGANDYVDVGNTIDLNNQSFTIEFWAEHTATGVFDYVVGQGITVNNQTLAVGFYNDNRFVFSFWANDLFTVAAYPDALWHHWACTYNFALGRRIIYRDGAVVASQPSGVAPYQGSLIVGQNLAIGGLVSTGQHFAGSVDELRIWGTERTPAEIQANMNSHYKELPDPNLKLYYRFDQAAGNVTDFSTAARRTHSPLR